jgi:hypothetical protein
MSASTFEMSSEKPVLIETIAKLYGIYEYYGMPAPDFIRTTSFGINSVDKTTSDCVKSLCDIIKASDVSQLDAFHEAYPTISLETKGISYCHCTNEPHPEFFSALDALTHTGADNPNVESSEFIDKLFSLGYLKTDDVYVLYKMIQNMCHYNKWDNAIQIFNHLDKNIIANTYFKHIPSKADGITYIDDIVTRFYHCHMTHYYGKIHGKALEFFKLLQDNGIKRHYIEGDSKTLEQERKFWDVATSVANFQTNEPVLFAERNIEYWNML